MNDLKFALRSLLKNPGFSLVAIVTLALGLGATTSMFSLLNTMFLRPLPFPDSSSLVRVVRTTPQSNFGDISAADFRALQAQAAGYGEFSGSFYEDVPASAPGRSAMLVNSVRATSNFFDVIRVRPEIGRTFTADEEAYGRDKVAIIGHFYWLEQWGGSPDVIGKTIRINGEPHTIVGVLPESADDGRLIRHTAIFRPLGLTAAQEASRTDVWLKTVGRRAAGVSAVAGNAFIAAAGQRAAHDFAKEDGDATWRAEPLMVSTGNPTAKVIIGMLIGLAGFVLVIACSNLANFLLARTLERSREFAVQSAIGASSIQLARPVAVEALMLASAGCILSIPIALRVSQWLSDQSVIQGGSPISFPVDWRVLGFAIASSLATGLFFGAAPALFIARMNISRSLGGGSRSATASAGHQRLRRYLVIGQFAMAMTLTAGAGFLIKGADDILRNHYGWDSANVVVGTVDLPKERYGSPEKILAFHRELIERLGAIPGAEAVAFSYWMPFGTDMGSRPYMVEGRSRPAKGEEPAASYNAITPGYLKVTGTRLLSGRMFTDADSAKSARVVIISESMANALFPGENPVGHRIAEVDSDAPRWSQIVGIAGDVRTSSIYQAPVHFQVYQPIPQAPWQYAMIGVRTTPGGSKEVLKRFPAEVLAIDPDLPVRDLMTADASVERAIADLSMLKKMLSALAFLGLALAAMGIYGVVARTVAQRNREIGIRMALGATMADIRRMILTSGLALALAGAAVGLAGAAGITRLLSTMVPGVTASGWSVAAVSTVVLALIAVAASYFPARAASSVDPVIAIRAD